MHAFLIIGKDPDIVLTKAKNLAIQYNAIFIELPLSKIEDVRNLSKTVKLKKTANVSYFIKNIENSSVESLNAFLKLLEEPNENNIFILSSKSENLVLPTILSRTQIIKAESAKLNLSKQESEEIEAFIKGDLSYRLEFIENRKKREEAAFFLEKLITAIHQKIQSEKTLSNSDLSLLKNANTAYIRIKANGNPTIQLINMVTLSDFF